MAPIGSTMLTSAGMPSNLALPLTVTSSGVAVMVTVAALTMRSSTGALLARSVALTTTFQSTSASVMPARSGKRTETLASPFPDRSDGCICRRSSARSGLALAISASGPASPAS